MCSYDEIQLKIKNDDKNYCQEGTSVKDGVIKLCVWSELKDTSRVFSLEKIRCFW